MDVHDYLRGFRGPWQLGLEGRLAAAPPGVAGALRPLLREARDHRERERHEEALADLLGGADPGAHGAVAAVLFPQFPDTARRTVEALLTRHPYTQGYARRAFRAPGERVQALRAAAWLLGTWRALRDYPQDLTWFAVHAGLLDSWQAHGLGLLLGQAVSDGHAEVLQILRDTAATQHPVARMGRHVPLALLSSTDPAAWALAEGLLLAAQRQEGLRQVILETVDEANVDAFVRVLRVILREDLLRFAATLRAACVWFGLNYDVTDVKTVRGLLTRALEFLEDADAARAAVAGADGVAAYLALYTRAMHGAGEAAALAEPLLRDPDPERRMAAAQFLLAAERLQGPQRAVLIRDPDLRLAALAGQAVSRWSGEPAGLGFEAYLAYAQRLPAGAAHQPLLFGWLGHVPARASAMDNLVAVLGDRPVSQLTPYLGQMSADGKSYVLARVRQRREETGEPLDAPTRELLLTLLQDRNSAVSQQAVTVMAHLTPDPRELGVIHGLLKRRSADLRRGLIWLLAADPAQAAASAAALLTAGSTEQRQAGLQLLAEIGGPPPPDFRPRNVTEETLWAQLTRPGEQPTLKDGLGLFDPAARTAAVPAAVRGRDYPADVRRGAQLLTSLDAVIAAHRETPLQGVGYGGEQTLLLGNVSGWMLRERDGHMPLAEVWDGWWRERPGPPVGFFSGVLGRLKPGERERPAAPDGDLTRMAWALRRSVARRDTTAAELEGELAGDGGDELDADERAEREVERATARRRQDLLRRTLHRTLGPPPALWLEHADLLGAVLDYLRGRYAGAPDTDLALDAWETALARLPEDVTALVDPLRPWRSEDPRDLLAPLRPGGDLAGWTPDRVQRLWQTEVYANTAFARLPRRRPPTALLLRAYAHGWANRHDLLDQLIGERPEPVGYSGRDDFDDLREFTRRRLRDGLPSHPDWQEAVDTVRARVLDVELARGDLETPATRPALALQSVGGAALTLRLLAGLGKNPLRRGYQGGNESRDATFSHLIRVSFPAPGDTPGTLARTVRELKLPQGRLLDLAMFAPQWADAVAAQLGWPGLRGGVYWLHAHTKDSQWSVPQEVRDAWEAEIAEHTPLGARDLTDGAVDVAWFRAVYAQLGAERFAALLEAAKYASSGGGHKRAELFARAILGGVEEAELRGRILDKRHQDAVRAVGLLPLSAGRRGAAQLEARYRLLSEFRKGARQFGAQRQASERLAADIGLHNLARSAGYTDPQRLMWAMEARMAPDWTATATADGVTVGVALSPHGEARLSIRRGERVLKALPPALKKVPEVVALRETVAELGAARERMRAALEDAMVRGDHFSPQELGDLARHPVIAPMLRGLLWVLGEGALGWWRGDELHTVDGPVPVGDGALRLAHPHDLFLSGAWPAWQRQVLEAELTQPFKQVFREYYPLTAAERGARRSARYAGHHVQPGRAAALFKARGWVAVPEEGVRKTFHAEGLNVWVDTAVGYGTPSEVEGAALNAVYFLPRGGEADGPLPLEAVPPRLLSEVLRDLDLVVSVAHVGGVDPEASLSTVEMRADLLRETLRLLRLHNVRLDNSHALIAGHHANYTVHLGSGTVHRQPGGFLCVIPVHNQHAGRVFLPFADPDPKTAEVVSKVLLLAEDKKIQDPTILEQLV